MNEISIRYVETGLGDTLQAIALRELGNSDRWVDLIWLNDLIPPFITDDATVAGDRVLLAGDKIALPMSGSTISPDDSETFGIDVSLNTRGQLSAENGDFVLKSGLSNLKMAITSRILTEKRIKGFNPEYGCWVGMLRGERLSSATLALAAFYVKSALLEDDRVNKIVSCVATADGDALLVTVVVQPIDGNDFSLEVSV